MTRNPILAAVVYFVLLILTAHIFAPPRYDWRQNTVSDLASQEHLYKWIMQAGLIGFGGILLAGAFKYFKSKPRKYFLVFVAIYGLFILLSGIFSTKPIDPSLAFSVRESNLHSLFASLAGFSMSLGILWQVFGSSNIRERGLRLGFLVLIATLSGLFGLAENQILSIDKGIVQRALYLVGLIWLVYEEKKLATEQDENDR